MATSLVKPTAALLAATLTIAFSQAGCTTWRTKRVYEEMVELERYPVGEPHYVHTSSAELRLGYGDVRSRRGRYRRHEGVGRVDAVEQTVCVQRMEVQYARPYTEVASPRRVGDIVGSSVLMGVGLVTLVSTGLLESIDDNTFSDFDDEPRDTNYGLGYAIGGTALGAGALWLGLSMALLPADPPPPTTRGEVLSSGVELAEATGCDLPTAPAPLPDTAARLRELERLRDSGAITEEEYEDARREIIRDL